MNPIPGHRSGRRAAGAAACVALFGLPAQADGSPEAMMAAFAAHCFDPRLTPARAEAEIAATGARVDFHDLAPFSDVPPTPGADVTPGTDRRCAVAFDGDHGAAAAEAAAAGLRAEGIDDEAPLPATHVDAALPGTTLLAARFLNPARVAVVHTGTRPGPSGPETFLSVERLTPEASGAVR